MKMKRQYKYQKGIAGVLAAVMVVSGAVAAGGGTCAYAAQTGDNGKEEIVYGILDANGTVEGIYVVNSFAGGDIRDYGDYATVKNLTSLDTITQKGEEVSFHSDEDRVSYQGDLKSKDLPWKIKVNYDLDGKACSPEELGGSSGQLKITMDITQNKACDDSFWEGYALQVSLALDGNRCKNIVADGATIADVGSDKQISYIILPGSGAEQTITADVTDFEMDGISFNGIRLNMDIQVDSQELLDRITDLQDAIRELDDGAQQLDQGADDLYDGSVALSSGAATLNQGVATLNQGIYQVQAVLNQLKEQSAALDGGSEQMLAALNELQSRLDQVKMDTEQLAMLSSASTQLKQGIDEMVAGLQLMKTQLNTYDETVAQQLQQKGISSTEEYITMHQQLIAGLTTAQSATTDPQEIALYQQTIALLTADQQYITGSSQLVAGIETTLDGQTEGTLMNGALRLQTNAKTFDASIQAMVTELEGMAADMAELKAGIQAMTAQYTQLNQGVNAYTDAVAQLSQGYGTLCTGAANVAGGASSLYQGTETLTAGALALYQGTTDMAEGTDLLREETTDMDEEVTDTIDRKLDEMTGKDVEVVSFVSDKNTDVDAVQFVIKTAAITIPEQEEAVTTEQESLTFWERLVNLFRKS